MIRKQLFLALLLMPLLLSGVLAQTVVHVRYAANCPIARIQQIENLAGAVRLLPSYGSWRSYRLRGMGDLETLKRCRGVESVRPAVRYRLLGGAFDLTVVTETLYCA